jgi:hypothetical protein
MAILMLLIFSNPYPDETTIQSIITRTTALCPELLPLNIVQHAVGLRPTRVGGPRFENETRSKFGKCKRWGPCG